MYRALLTIWYRNSPSHPTMNTVELRFDESRIRLQAKMRITEQYEREGFSITWVDFDAP